MEGHTKNCVERYCELSNKRIEQSYKVSTPVLMTIIFQKKKEELGTVGEFLRCLLADCSTNPFFGVHRQTRQIMVSELFSKIFHDVEQSLWQEIGQVDILHSLRVWIQTVLSRGKHSANLDYFKMLTVWVSWRIQKSTLEGVLCIFGSHTFVPVGWSCKEQTAVSHSSTEAEVISLNAGLRLDAIPASSLWDSLINVEKHKRRAT